MCFRPIHEDSIRTRMLLRMMHDGYTVLHTALIIIAASIGDDEITTYVWVS